MALDLEDAMKVAEYSDEEPLILRLIAEVQMLRRENDLADKTIVRLSTELAYSEARAERLKAHNSEMVAAVVAAQADGLFDTAPRDYEVAKDDGNT